jgi:hypothetical protein
VNGQMKCNHCNQRVSPNIWRAKQHLLVCPKFLATEAAQKAADSDQDVAAALKARR